MRSSLVHPIESRDGTLSKDEVLRNFMVDPIQPSKIQKRPALTRTDLYAVSGQGFGSFVFNDYIYVWTDTTPPTSPIFYDYVPDYWGVGQGGGYAVRWENNQQIIEVPEDVFIDIEVGDTVTISGVSPYGYNGTCLVVVDKKTAAQMGVGNGNSILITNLSNPGVVVQGGVAKKLRPCSGRPAFPYSAPAMYGKTLNQIITGAGSFTTSETSSSTGLIDCGVSGRTYTTVTYTKLLKWNGTTVLSGTKVRTTYNTGAGAEIGYDETQSNYVTGVGASSYTLQSGQYITDRCYCDNTTGHALNTLASETITITQSNAAFYEVQAYTANKAAYDALCCP